ncbi:hypothetical protein KKD52_05835 [Myxococcota bacterium]|nr:hypothetical protein [Myxococcota bacterium]MBU1413887.1 hypothetical protein [Myxococcota bacterium]MBU1509862.1 hypothetical protein [Myxococcota bacterium]
MRPLSARRLQWISGLLLVLLYALGLGTGVGLTRWLTGAGPGRHEPGGPHGPHGPPPNGQLIDQLNLTPEQDRQVRAIYERYNPELEKILEENFPRIRAVQEKVEKEIRALLTEAQQQRLDAAKSHRRPGPSMRQGPLDIPPPPPPR